MQRRTDHDWAGELDEHTLLCAAQNANVSRRVPFQVGTLVPLRQHVRGVGMPLGGVARSSQTGLVNPIGTPPLSRTTARTYDARPLNSTFVLADKLATFASTAPEPFFGYWAPFAPHLPGHVPASYSSWCAAPGNTLPLGPNFNEADVSDKPAWIRSLPRLTPSHESVQRTNKCKAFTSLQVVDDAIEQIFQTLQDSGRLDNTIVVLTSDNGYSFDAHRYDKKACAYEECVRAPIGVRYPRGPLDNRQDNRVLGTVDLARTFTELAGSNPDISQDGSSFVPLLDQQAFNWRPLALIEMARRIGHPSFYGVRDRSWKYVELDTGEKELYDLRNDPYELLNRAGAPSYSSIQAKLAAELQRLKN